MTLLFPEKYLIDSSFSIGVRSSLQCVSIHMQYTNITEEKIRISAKDLNLMEKEFY